MKKNIFIIIAIALVCFGCGREQRGKLTQRGKEIHDSWEKATFDVIETDVIPTFHLDAWINAENDSIRYSIEDQYFPNYRIRPEENNVYAIYYGSVKMLIVNTFGQSLNDEGSHWQISKPTPDEYYNGTLPQFYFFGGEKLHLSKDGEQWRIQMDSTECYGSSCDWHIKPLANEGNILFAKETYTLSGNGLYKYMSGDVSLQYNIERNILREAPYEYGYCYCNDGVVQLIAHQQDFDDINVKAEYIGDNSVSITYRGVTEIW